MDFVFSWKMLALIAAARVLGYLHAAKRFWQVQAVGIIGFVVTYAIYLPLTVLSSMPPNRLWVVGYGAGSITTFALNKIWTFEMRGWNTPQFIEYVLIRIGFSVVGSGLMYVSLHYLWTWLAPVVPMILFLWPSYRSQQFVFRARPARPKPAQAVI